MDHSPEDPECIGTWRTRWQSNIAMKNHPSKTDFPIQPSMYGRFPSHLSLPKGIRLGVLHLSPFFS
jgi:hypothetical protein